MNFILALDQGTTSSRAMLVGQDGRVHRVAQTAVQQMYPQPGWVEHDPLEIWSSQVGVATEALSQAGITAEAIAAIGIANQRETTVVWHRRTGMPIHNAIVWQDRRTAPFCEELRRRGLQESIQQKTGLVIDAYFSASKIRWILDNVTGAKQRATRGELAFGTVDSWLIWKLTNGARHITDTTNASRTMLFNLHAQEWDNELLDLFGIPRSLLPEVIPSSGVCGQTAGLLSNVPIAGIAGDQQAALLGQMCVKPGMAKCTYGTGSFLLLNTGEKAVSSRNNLIATPCCTLDKSTCYALEGSIFIAGAVVQWLRDELQIVHTAGEIETLAAAVPDSDGVYFVPAFSGLGAPYWDQYARGTLLGLTRGTTRAHIARAALEGIAFQVVDVLTAMESDSGVRLHELRVDGGAAGNNLLMQIQADLLGIPVLRPRNTETTAVGASYLAGIAVGYWPNQDAIAHQWTLDRSFTPQIDERERENRKERWRRAVERAKRWDR